MGKYSKDVRELLKDTRVECEVLDGTKVERTFFSLTIDDLVNVFSVLPDDSLEVARQKIMSVVSTDEFLYKKFNKNPMFWEIKEFSPGFYTVPVKEEKILSKKDLKKLGYVDAEIEKMRLPAKSAELIQTYQQKLSIKFVRRTNYATYDPVFLEDFKKKYLEEFKKSLHTEGLVSYLTKQKFDDKKPHLAPGLFNSNVLLVIPDVELHAGKLASKFDSKDSYDYKKAMYRFIRIFNEAEKVQEMYCASEIVMTIGNDFYNSDTEQNTTTAGTDQHNDTRFQQMIINGIEAHIWAIEKMKKTCNKVILKFHPGNHDFLIDFTLYQHLYELYKNDPKVSISNDVKSLRYTTSLNWGKNLIVFTHGKTPEGKAASDDKLATLPNDYFREEAKKADYVTVHAGHWHQSSENQFSKKTTASNGVAVLRSGSPTGEGAWEGGNQYVSDKTHNVYIYDANRGLYATINIHLTENELQYGIETSKITDDSDVKDDIRKSILKAEELQYVTMLKKEKRIISNDIKKLSAEYTEKVRKIAEAFGIDIGTDELDVQTTKIVLDIIGYNEKTAPFFDKMDEIDETINVRTRKDKDIN